MIGATHASDETHDGTSGANRFRRVRLFVSVNRELVDGQS